MDRLTRKLACLTVAAAATAVTAGCHNVRDKVPPRKAFANNGKVAPLDANTNPVEFSTQQPEPPVTANGLIGSAPGNVGPGGSSNSALSSANSPGNAYGNLNSNNRFGGPGTSGLGTPPAMAPAAPVYPPRPPDRAESPSSVVGQPADAPSPY